MKKVCLMFAMLLCLLLGGCGAVEEETTAPSPASEPPQCLSFQGIEELRAFVSATGLPEEEFQSYMETHNYDMNGVRDKDDLTALKEQLAAAPFPEVSGGTLFYVDIYPESQRLFVEYRLKNGDSARFRIRYSEWTDSDKQTAFVYTNYDVDHGSHWFQGEVDGCAVVYWYFGAEEDAFTVIEEQTIFRPWTEIGEDLPVTTRDYSSLEEFEAATTLPVYYLPQGIPEGYTLGRIGSGAVATGFYYVPEDGRDWDHMELELAISREECFVFVFRSWEADGDRGEDIFWNEQRRLYSWVQDGHELTLKIPKGYSVLPDEIEALCAVETVVP